MSNLKAVLQNLKSDKIKERQEGVASVRTVFSQDRVVTTFHLKSDGSSDPRAWLSVFQALFQTVLSERLIATKKTTTKSSGSSVATAQKRLGEAASTVRWLTERTVQFMNKRVVKAMFEHFLQTMVHDRELFAPVALDYIKALKCLVSHTPHLEHLEDDTWIRMVEMGFNVILGNSVKARFDDEALIGSPSDSHELSHSDLSMDDYSELADDGDFTPKKNRKRVRSDNDAASVSNVAKSKSQSKQKTQRTVTQTSVSLEQVEFMSLLSVLLRSRSSPILSLDYPYLPSAILRRLQQFLERYPGDSSLLQDYLSSVHSSLSVLALNRKHDVERFARTAWDSFVGLWGTKNRSIKEALVCILRILLPFLTSNARDDSTDLSSFNCAESLSRLWHVLDGEAENRWGIDGLTLDALRLELTSLERSEGDHNPAFVANTFRYGWNFDAVQALSWAILELQADVAGKLFEFSESMHSSLTPGPASEGKRIRLESPIVSLLGSIEYPSTTNVRAYHLQILLFFVDRHWAILHESLRQDVIQVLHQHISSDDTVIQSWVFMCFAAIAYAEGSLPSFFPRTFTKGSSEQSPPFVTFRPLSAAAREAFTWDSIWTNAIRRVNVPLICRSACHAAYTLLVLSTTGTSGCLSLTSQRVLLEIETLAKDLDVQGPAYPYDSVCAFLAQCLKVANQDMRLHRMQIEEKVVSWLVDCWKVAGFEAKRAALHTVQDMLLLLESICGLQKRTDLLSRLPLPQCQITETLVEEWKTAIIRDFLLDARLPSFRKPSLESRSNGKSLSEAGKPILQGSKRGLQYIPPRPRERKISAFILKTIEGLLDGWDAANGYSKAEVARRCLDMAIIALAFETVLAANEIQPDRRLLQSACKLAVLVTNLLTQSQWTNPERALIALGLDPLFRIDEDVFEDGFRHAMLPPDTGTGIKNQILASLTTTKADDVDHLKVSRTDFLRLLWQNNDIQDSFASIAVTLRSVLYSMTGQTTTSRDSKSIAAYDKDEFGPIRTSALQHGQLQNRQAEDTYTDNFMLETCVSFLTVGTTFQSSSGEPTRDKELVDLVIGCADSRPDIFIQICPILLESARKKYIGLSITNLDGILEEMSRILQLYSYSRSHQVQLLAIRLIDSTMPLWASPQVAVGDVLEKIRSLCTWLSTVLKGAKMRSWKVRDRFAQFMDKYMTFDPRQQSWCGSTDEEDPEFQSSPEFLLPFLNADEDIRVRFRVSTCNARLFARARIVQRSVLELYNSIKRWYTVDLDNYEHMLTRMLSLGNIMITCSAVRRGPYWHLLETCIHSPLYSKHIQVILQGVTQRMGLQELSTLFESYASQLAYSIRNAQSDILRFPPHLLGYQNRRECAERTFRLFTPTNIWLGGRKLFEAHCHILQITTDEGLEDCFGDVIGYKIVTWIDEIGDVTGMDASLQEMTFKGSKFDQCLAANMDGIVASILRTLGDQDVSPDGPIGHSLNSFDSTGTSHQVFRALTIYRHMDESATHEPNLPAFPAETLLTALNWLGCRLPDVDKRSITYHVMHRLLADIEQSPLVNEQIRVLNALCLWISYRHLDFEDISLLQTLIHGATTLLRQLDLARASQSILEWAFNMYQHGKTKDSRFPDVLIRISCIGHDHATFACDEHHKSIGLSLMDWIDAQAVKLSKVAEIRSQVIRVIPAWPYPPSQQLGKLCENVSSESLSAILMDHRISSNKFRMVHRLLEISAVRNHDMTHEFSRSHFWRLKECMPPVNQLQENDIDAFASLIFSNAGQVESFNQEVNMTSILSRHIRHMTKQQTSSSDGGDKTQEAIIMALLEMLHCDSPSKVHIAYDTLRLIASITVKNVLSLGPWLSDYLMELRYLETFPLRPRAKTSMTLDDLTTDLLIHSAKDFSKWIGMFTELLCNILSEQETFYAQLISILKRDHSFAEQILPLLVYRALVYGNASTDTIRTCLSTYFTTLLTAESTCTPCLRSIVTVVLHLRSFHSNTADALSYNKWLEIDFTLLAEKSLAFGAYTTALLFLELAIDSQTPSDVGTISTEQILYEIYRHIDEPDGFYGINDSDIHRFLIKRFHHENQWEKAFQFHGAILEAGGRKSTDTEGLVKSFHSFGFDHLAIETIQSSLANPYDNASSSTSYRLGWRTETWDLPDHGHDSPGASLYFALRAIHRERDENIIDNVIQHSLRIEMSRLRDLGPENFAEIRETLSDIMCLREVKKWRQDPIRSLLIAKQVAPAQWNDLTKLDNRFEFRNLEGIMATRVSLVRSAIRKEERQQIGLLVSPYTQSLINVEKDCLIHLSKAARDANHIQIALNSIIRAQRLEETPSFKVEEEFASVLWSHKEESMAVQYLDRLRAVGSSNQGAISPLDRAIILSRLGSWSFDACLKKPTDIRDDYFNKAVEILNTIGSSIPPGTMHSTVYHQCAIFAERQYHAISKSPDAIRWRVYVDRKKQEIQSRHQEILRTQDEQRAKTLHLHQTKAHQLLKEDSEHFRSHNLARDIFLKQAIDMYSRCLQSSDEFDDSAIRLCSLWFSNFDDDETGLQSNVRLALDRIPSRKLVFLSHQLSARISKNETGSASKGQESLHNLVLRMCREHPFHSLYQVYALKPKRDPTARQSGRLSSSTQTSRGIAAIDIFDRLRNDPPTNIHVRNVELLCKACLQWAQYPIRNNAEIKRSRNRSFAVPRDCLILTISNLRVPVLTCHLPPDPTMRYDDCPWIARYENTFETAGGINLPKIIACVDTAGQKHKQLFKGEGNDDLRQDAVMVQVFGLVNTILERDRETRRRNLSIRDYKVIPLGDRAGVMEYVSNTATLQQWLLRAHERYHPTDFPHKKASAEFQAAQDRYNARQSDDALNILLQDFDSLKRQFRPVMRHYFAERHKSPMTWFSMRLNYTRSVATSSIVGHILGLGDRHTTNILLDNSSGAVVHIDLGIAFDQGKYLTVPELVPFRMTRDIVDGMGISGTRGVFQRCVEETLRVLREGSEVIMTVLEVFKHDPLHTWTASEVKIRRVQAAPTEPTLLGTSRLAGVIGIDMTSGTAEEAADRALSAVARKLDKSLSVQYVVNQLVADATDDRNLALIYHGWSPLC